VKDAVERPLLDRIEILCKDWADDHTQLQKMCRDVGCTEAEVEGSPDGVPGILELAELLMKRTPRPAPTPPVVDGNQSSLKECIRRMEAVGVGFLEDVYYDNSSMGAKDVQLPDDHDVALEAVRSCLIAAAREGQAEPTTKTFTAHGKTWTKHTPGDAMPCDGEAMIEIILPDGGITDVTGSKLFARSARINMWDSVGGWRYADQPKTEQATMPDPYAELKAAHAEGKVIQCQMEGINVWQDVSDVSRISHPVNRYRIKPWTLPTPPEGREWHRGDWTENMLPAGWRPLLRGEVPVIGTDSFMFNGRWIVEDAGHVHLPMRDSDTHQRTRRPLPTPPKLIPLDINDIRATDEFKYKEGQVIQSVASWNAYNVELPRDGVVDYKELATDFTRRQHGSTEWKPCTKEAK